VSLRFSRLLLALGTLPSLALGPAFPAAAQAQVANVSADLQQAISAARTPTVNWARDIGGARYVKVLIQTNTSDPAMAALRQAVLAAGGSVYRIFVSLPAMSALLLSGSRAVLSEGTDGVASSSEASPLGEP